MPFDFDGVTRLQCLVNWPPGSLGQVWAFREQWDTEFALIGVMWRRHWPKLISIIDFMPEVREVTYKTNAIESLKSTIRKLVRKRRFLPIDTAALNS
jgi:transposase-like protein